MRKVPPLHALRAFEATARHASVTQAADELRVSHSAVSQQVRSLEDYFGQSLFHRNGRRVEPTEAAKALLDEVRTAFDRIAIAAEQFAVRNGSAAITVNATPSFAMRWLIPKSSAFQLANPAVNVVTEISLSDRIDHLTKSYDFVIRREPMKRADHVCVKLIEDHSTAVLSPQLWTSLKAKEPQDLKRAVLLHLKSRPEAWQRWFEISGSKISEPPPGPYYEHFFLSMQAAINGLGVAVGPLCLVEDDLAHGRLIAPFAEHILAGPGFYVLYPTTTMRSRSHRAFLDALKQAAKLTTVATDLT